MSMFCVCGKKASCIDSRHYIKKMETRRRYVCTSRKCGRRWTTLELVASNEKRSVRAKEAKITLTSRLTNEMLSNLRLEVDKLFDARQFK